MLFVEIYLFPSLLISSSLQVLYLTSDQPNERNLALFVLPSNSSHGLVLNSIPPTISTAGFCHMLSVSNSLSETSGKFRL